MGFEMLWNQMNQTYSMPYHQMTPYQMSMSTIPDPKVTADNNIIPQGISAPLSAPFQLTAVADQIKVDDLKDRIKVKLVEEDLWERFKKVQLEMIITKGGRNLFPKLNFTVEGLEPENCYLFSMAFRRVGNEKYKFTKSEWVSAGHADEEFEQKEYPHIENARFPKGSDWMKSELSFAKLKLTNNQEGNVCKNAVVLRSMHKYCPVLIIYRFDPETSNFERLMEKEIHLGTFIAVTAYQNQNVTKLKINNNPFAKGFREGGRKRSHPIEPASPAKMSPNSMFPSFMNPLACFQNWYNPNALSNNFSAYYNQAFQAQNPIFGSQANSMSMFPAGFGFQ